MKEFTVHTSTAAEPGLSVSSYLPETGDGVVPADAGLLVRLAGEPGAGAVAAESAA